VLFAGGSSLPGNILQTQFFETVDIYDDASGQWDTAMLSQARVVRTVAVVGKQALFVGGSVAPSTKDLSDVVDIYDDATGQWASAHLSQARDGIRAVTVGSQVVLAGGTLPDGLPSDAIDTYDSATRQWSTARLSTRQFLSAVATVGQKAVFAGDECAPRACVPGTGVDLDLGPSDAVDIYDGATGEWATANLSEARRGIAVVTVGRRVLIAGGTRTNEGDASNAVDIYDDVTGSWSTGALSEARWSATAVSIGGQALFAGGIVGLTPPARDRSDTPRVDIYDSTTGAWSTGSLSRSRGLPRYGFVPATVGSRAIFAGGFTGARAGVLWSAEVDTYDSATGQWTGGLLSSTSSTLFGTTVGTQVLIIGQVNADIYESTTDQWSAIPLPRPGTLTTPPAAVGRRMLLASGDRVDIYDSAAVP